MRWITLVVLFVYAERVGFAQTANPFRVPDAATELKWMDLSNEYRKNYLKSQKLCVVIGGHRTEHHTGGGTETHELHQVFAADYARRLQRAFVQHNEKYTSDSLMRGNNESYFKLNDVLIENQPGESPKTVGFNPLILSLNGTPAMATNGAKTLSDVSWYLDHTPALVHAVKNHCVGRWYLPRNRIAFDAKGERISDLERMIEVTVDEDLGFMPIRVKHYLVWNRRQNVRLAFETNTTWELRNDGRWVPLRCEGKEYSVGGNDYHRVMERVDCQFRWQFDDQVPDSLFSPEQLGSLSLERIRLHDPS